MNRARLSAISFAKNQKDVATILNLFNFQVEISFSTVRF